ncbi:enoyl-CoA hydratase/isomerase family protein [Streptomyces celluloflavus]|uniref:enoyl-CoA hydratase/isomerase family protein n=1 Tax=Streptomyces celluloflavus TaxID=58344 RepID=UPI0036DE7918
MTNDTVRESFKTLEVAHEGPVLTVRLNSPESGNALSGPMLDDLLTVLGAAQDAPEIRVLILSGAGADFCLGGDRGDFARSLAADGTGASLRGMGDKARRVCDALATANAVTIARLHGRVVGAGIALAVFCDLRAGADTCRFRLPELALGLPPAWGGVLPRLLNESGAARIRELILTGESFDAAKAAELSLLHRAVPEEELDDVIARWTGPLVRRSPAALRSAKMMLNAYAGANRLADATLFDAELLASVLVAAESARRP